MERGISFVADFEEWKAIRKLKIDSSVKEKHILLFLANLLASIENKANSYLARFLGENELEALLKEAEGKSLEEALKTVSGSKLTKILEQKIDGFDKKQAESIKAFAKILVAKRLLNSRGTTIFYDEASDKPSLSKKLVGELKGK